MRLSVSLLVLSLAGVLGGAALIGVWAIGLGLIFDSVCVGAWALMRDDGKAAPQVRGAPTLHDVLERHRQAS